MKLPSPSDKEESPVDMDTITLDPEEEVSEKMICVSFQCLV